MTIVTDHSAGAGEQPLVDRLLALVRQRTGVDFTLYRPATVRRRISNRMMCVGATTLHEYLAHLESNPGEADGLLARLTIKVSRFYRNSATFDHLRAAVIPELAKAGRPLRFWSIGCGRGEEAYTLAMLLADAGADGVVHATDIDPEALQQAADATYGPDALGDLPCPLAAQYLEPAPDAAGPRYRVREAVRARVVFSRHDITVDDRVPGDAAFDLVAFRNVAIYFRHEVQDGIYARVAHALLPGGVLCVGEAEWPSAALASSLDCDARRLRLFRSHRQAEPAAA